MRNITLVFFLSLTFLIACSPRPTELKSARQIVIPREKIKEAAETRSLWFVTSNYTTGGRLGRLDLQDGTLVDSIGVTGADVVLTEDGSKGLFLISRMGQDGVASIGDRSGRMNGVFRLPSRSNPQWAVRDPLGRVWVSSQESNRLLVLDQELRARIAEVDLSMLALPSGNSDLSQMVLLDDLTLAVSAQRLHRSSTIWHPDSSSGLALVDLNLLNVRVHTLIEAMNPIGLQKIGNSQLRILGGGDYTASGSANGSLLTVSGADGKVLSNSTVRGKIVAADPSLDAMIVWQPELFQSCIVVAGADVECYRGDVRDEGFVFNAIRRTGNVIFVSFKTSLKAELWILSASNSFSLQKISMELPVQSLSFGP